MKRFLYSVLASAGRIIGKIRQGLAPVDVYMLFPLASVGGAELVHLDVLKALYTRYRVRVLFWYRYNPWLPLDQRTEENHALFSQYKEYAPGSFFEDKTDQKRFSGLFNAFWLGIYQGRMNHRKTVVVIRNGDTRTKTFLSSFPRKCAVLSIVHNAYFETQAVEDVANYLDLDFDPDVRVIISEKIKDISETVAKATGRTIKGKTVVIHNAVPLPQNPVKKSTDRFYVLFAGRDVSEKRLPLMYEIAKRMEALEPGITFVFAGPNAANYTPLGNTVFHGEVRDQQVMAGLYELAHVFLMTSSSEGFPRSMAEAMAYGAVVVSTAVGAIPEHIKNENGILVWSSSEDQIVSNSIDGILGYYRNREEMERAGAKNGLYAHRHFSFEHFSQAYLQQVAALQNA